MKQLGLFSTNAERAAEEYGYLIGRPAEWTRTFSVFVDGKRPTFRDDPRRIIGMVVGVAGCIESIPYSPRLIVNDGDADWWLPPAIVQVNNFASSGDTKSEAARFQIVQSGRGAPNTSAPGCPLGEG